MEEEIKKCGICGKEDDIKKLTKIGKTLMCRKCKKKFGKALW